MSRHGLFIGQALIKEPGKTLFQTIFSGFTAFFIAFTFS